MKKKVRPNIYRTLGSESQQTVHRSSLWVRRGAGRPQCGLSSCSWHLNLHTHRALTRLHSSNNPASLTQRLGATIDVEQNHVRFLGDLILNLWDCGGQDAFMDSYLSTQQATIFQHVGVLIYVFEVESRSITRDLEYYAECMAALRKHSPNAAVFLLVHKMDLVRQPKVVLDRKAAELRKASGGTEITVFGTSIYDETLYKVTSTRVSSYMAECTNCARIGLVTNSAHPHPQRICAHQTPR